MKKLTYLLFLAIGVTACSVESMDSTENLTVADAKYKMQQTENPMGFYAGGSGNLKGTLSVWNDCDNLYVQIVPEGDAPEDAKLGVFMDGALPSTNGGSKNINTDGFLGLDSANDLTWTISLNKATSFNIFVNAWSDWAGASSSVDFNQDFTNYTVDYTGCNECEESFSYNDNEDGTYTFTYIPAEDMDNADVVFTFAQGVVVDGLDEWTDNGVTKQNTLNFEGCKVYSWTVKLDTNCKGQGQQKANLWTDFKIGEDSKKGDLENIMKNCN